MCKEWSCMSMGSIGLRLFGPHRPVMPSINFDEFATMLNLFYYAESVLLFRICFTMPDLFYYADCAVD